MALTNDQIGNIFLIAGFVFAITAFGASTPLFAFVEYAGAKVGGISQPSAVAGFLSIVCFIFAYKFKKK